MISSSGLARVATESKSTMLVQRDESVEARYTTGAACKQFHLFSKLPASIQLKTWTLAAPPTRTHIVEIYEYSATAYNVYARVRIVPPLPPLFSATSGSRQAIITAQGGEVITLVTRPIRVAFYFNFAHDIIFLSSRFASNLLASETYRLREMETLMHYQHLSRLQRLIVTYSGVDDFSRIAFSMRWLKKLDTLYIAMIDKWSKKTVEKMVRNGFPPNDYVAAKIGQRLSELEGEETEDEWEEGEEDGDTLCERNVRIVEVELRLEMRTKTRY